MLRPGRGRAWLSPAVKNPTDDPAADGADDQDRRVGLRYERVRDAEKQTEDNPDEPSWPWELNAANNKADTKSADERRQQRRRLFRKLHRQHGRDHDRPED